MEIYVLFEFQHFNNDSSLPYVTNVKWAILYSRKVIGNLNRGLTELDWAYHAVGL